LLGQIHTIRGLIVDEVGFGAGGAVDDRIMGHTVGLGGVGASNLDRPVVPPPLEFELGQRQSALQDAGIVGGLDVLVEHVDEQGWLRSVQVVDASAVGNESELFQLIHKILEGRVGHIVELGLDETLDNPETIPIICEP